MPVITVFITLASASGAQPKLTRLVLIDLDANLSCGLDPVEVDVLRLWSARDDLGEVRGDFPHPFQFWTADSILHRPSDWRPELEWIDPRHYFGKLSARIFSSLACSRLRASTSFATITAWAKKSFGNCTSSGR
jgi:hypothetical protein